MITLFRDPIFNAFDKVFEQNFSFAPQSNIKKNDDGYVITLCVPGLTKDDLKISTKDGVLKISYEKSEEIKDKYFVNSFIKSYNLPDDVKEKDIEGKVENGVLILNLPLDKRKALERLISLN